MSIKAVGFDYGGVIGGVGSNGLNFTRQICEILGVDEPTYKDVYFGMNYKINTGEIESWHEFWKLFVDKIGKPEKYDAVVNLSNEADKHLQVIDEKMLGLADRLRTVGYKVGLLSNNTVENAKKMRHQSIDKHFDVFHISAETKLMKPSPQAFEYLAEELGVRPNEMAFIDDAEKSLSTADEVGFKPVLFESYDKLEEQLTKLGVL